jgi:hypothetical protein
MGEMTEAEAAIMLAGALQNDLIYRLDLLHEAGAPKLILAATLLDLALQLISSRRRPRSCAANPPALWMLHCGIPRRDSAESAFLGNRSAIGGEQPSRFGLLSWRRQFCRHFAQ